MEHSSCVPGNASPEILFALNKAGWAPDRAIDISVWIETLEAVGFEINSRARCLWTEFGGLHIRSSSLQRCGSSLAIDPVDACIDAADEANRLLEEYAENHSPLGMWSIQYRTYVAATGRIIAIGPGGDWELGKNLLEALNFVVRGGEPRRYIGDE